MAELKERLLQILDEKGSFDTLTLAAELGVFHQKVVGGVKSLQIEENVINAEALSKKGWELTDEGKEVAKEGSHEARVFHAIPEGGIAQDELMKAFATAKIGFSKAMSSGWVEIKKGEGKPLVRRKVESIDDTVQPVLKRIEAMSFDEVSDKDKQEFKKRKLINEVAMTYYHVTKGSNFTTQLNKQETDLTAEMIASGSWKGVPFKGYNFNALGAPPPCGHLHPLLKVRAEFRQIFLEMGFTEMHTNNYIESSFWNFDALFQPQQHPARDAHDTFFVSEPANCLVLPDDYVKKVGEMHSHGGHGSQGYSYDWKLDEAKKNILRTHTTAVSARMLYRLAQEKPFKPAKYFSIDRVFRNEALDATHLAEFHQIEGVIADRNLTLGHLIGMLYAFFKKLGIHKLRFKPAYNPYTEPSMEVFSYHEGLKKWVEIGNSGVFRPEMLLPMGLPEDVRVIAWGLSLERPTMIKYGIDNIRELVGHKINLKVVYDNPICRLETD